MQADPLVCGRLSEVLSEMQEVQLQQDECTVCMDRPCSVTLLPCGHRVRAGNDKVRVGQQHTHTTVCSLVGSWLRTRDCRVCQASVGRAHHSAVPGVPQEELERTSEDA
jgi:hypothetical protein